MKKSTKEKIKETPKLCQCKIPKWLRIVKFILPIKNAKENLLQYIMRQFLIPDSSGNPSITSTILFFTMALIAAITLTEIKNSQVWISTVMDKTTTISKPLGFSDHFLYLIILLSGTITAYYRSRQNKLNSNEAGEKSSNLISAIIAQVKKKLK